MDSYLSHVILYGMQHAHVLEMMPRFKYKFTGEYQYYAGEPLLSMPYKAM